MIEESLIKSNFIGRDGFRWWIGQIPPFDSVENQVKGEGWGNRVKVRILGYHPANETELPNKDLPWAQILLPTTAGSGAANYAVNPKLRPGDVVIGFFLDGDNAQIPIIMGAMGRTSEVGVGNYQYPFVPFTGYNDKVQKPNGRLAPDQSNESNIKSQPTPRQIPQEVADRTGNNEVIAFSGIGKEVVFADTCEDTSTKTIKTEVNNLLKAVQDTKNKLSDLQQKISAVADVIKSSIEWIVGKMFDRLFNELITLIQKGLDKLYKSVYAQVLSATGNPGAAHQAGVASNAAFIEPVKILEKAISCVAAAVVNGLRSLIENLLTSLIENIKQFVSCAADQFLGSLLNSVVDSIADGLSSAIGGIASLLSAGFNVASFLRDSVDSIKSIGGLFDCNQSQDKCSGKVKEWVIGQGPKGSSNVDQTFDNILNAMNTASSIEGFSSDVNQILSSVDIFNGFSNIQGSVGSFGNCYTGLPTSCNPPTVNIFGGGGSGATAVPIFGSVLDRTGLFNNVQKTSSIIGARVTNGGSGYTFPPFVEFVDNCGMGYGAIGRALIENGEVVGIYMVSSGENYPYGDQEQYGIGDVVIQSPGYDYVSTDYAYDNFGNRYQLKVEDGSIVFVEPINKFEVTEDPIIRVQSETGFGAVLKPILAPLSQIPDSDPIKQIDCVK